MVKSPLWSKLHIIISNDTSFIFQITERKHSLVISCSISKSYLIKTENKAARIEGEGKKKRERGNGTGETGQGKGEKLG